MATLTYFFATVSPFTYLAGTRLEEICAHHGLEIDYRPLDVIALFARTGGVAPKDRHESRLAYRLQELERQARKTGLPLNLKPAFWPANPAPSSYAFIAAQSAVRAGKAYGDLGALAHGFTRACWAEERNIAEDDVVRDVLAGAGFDPSLADSGMLAGAETYAANLEDAVRMGAFGAPFYITPDDRRFWGQDRLDDLDLALKGEI